MFIYIATSKRNEVLNIFKIGKTMNLENRLKDYNCGRTEEDKYFYVYFKKVESNLTEIELQIHKTLNYCRYQNTKEIYKNKLDILKLIIDDVSDYYISELKLLELNLSKINIKDDEDHKDENNKDKDKNNKDKDENNKDKDENNKNNILEFIDLIKFSTENTQTGTMYKTYKIWCDKKGYKHFNNIIFNNTLKENNIRYSNKRNGYYYWFNTCIKDIIISLNAEI